MQPWWETTFKHIKKSELFQTSAQLCIFVFPISGAFIVCLLWLQVPHSGVCWTLSLLKMRKETWFFFSYPSKTSLTRMANHILALPQKVRDWQWAGLIQIIVVLLSFWHLCFWHFIYLLCVFRGWSSQQEVRSNSSESSSWARPQRPVSHDLSVHQQEQKKAAKCE